MRKGPCLIAVVDDESSVRTALGRLIRVAGFNVDTYATGADFLHAMERRRPDCVVLDLRMPHVSGFDVQQALQQLDGRIPVLVLTGDDTAYRRERAMRHGAAGYLRKPVDDALLIDSIKMAVGGGLASTP
jgi:two-component system response regulator FixJ